MFSFMVFIVNWYLFNNIHIFYFSVILVLFIIKCRSYNDKDLLNSPTSEVPLGGHQPFVSLSTMLDSEFSRKCM